MDEREMASEKAGLAIISTGELTSQGSGSKLHLHIGKRTGTDSATHSNEDLHLGNSAEFYIPGLNDRLHSHTIRVDPAIEPLPLTEPANDTARSGSVGTNPGLVCPRAGSVSPVSVSRSGSRSGSACNSHSSNGGSGSESQHRCPNVVVDTAGAGSAGPADDGFVLTPMPDIDDSGLLFESVDQASNGSSRVLSADDIERTEVMRDGGLREPGSTTSDLSSPPFSANTLSDVSDSLIFRDTLHEKDLTRSTNGHISDSGSRGLNDSTNLSINSSIHSNSSSSVNKGSKNSDKKKKGSSWYNVLSPTYKSRSEDFKRIFKDIPNDERLMVDYSCALQKDILVHGRLYITQNWICFYANIFRWETVLTIRCSTITAMTKEKTARVIPNAIQVCTDSEKYFITSFGARDKTYLMLFRVWQNALMDQPMSPQELWQWVHYSYGDDLGLTSSDDDYAAPTKDEEEKFLTQILTQEELDDNQDKDTTEDTETVLNATGENGHVLPIPSPVNTKLSSPSNISTNSDNHSMVTNSTEDVEEGGHAGVARLEVPSPGAGTELPTDMGDTTEEEEEDEVTCVGHDHPGFTTLDDSFNLSCDQVFELLFTESEFYQEFVKARKTYDLLLSPWPVEPDFENRKTRMITYTLSLNYSIGPKCSPSTEKQTLYGESKPGSFYVIDCEVVNGGIPYGDNFYVVNRFCIMRLSAHKCRIRVTSDLRYKKTVWGLVKNIIEKNAHTGLNENFSLLAQHLQAEAEKKQLISGQTTKATQMHTRKKVLRRRRCPSNADRSPSAKRPAEGKHLGSGPGTYAKGEVSKYEWQLQFNADTVVRVVCTVLLLLVLFNAVLFYKLWSLEARAASPRFDRTSLLSDLGTQTRTQEEWIGILEQQQQLHDLELERWKDILASSVQLMEQMKNVLQGLQSSIEKRARVVMEASSSTTPHA